MPYLVWLVIQAIQWAAVLIAATVAMRVATALVRFWWPVPLDQRRRDGRWLLGWLVVLAVAVALVHCQAGTFFAFSDPLGNNWSLDAHGWPLAQPDSLVDAAAKTSGAASAIYATAMLANLGCSLLLLMATRGVLDRGLAAWDAPRRWPALGREAAAWLAALVVVLVCEPLAARPLNFPGTDLILYSTLIYERPGVRIGVLIGLASAVFWLGIGLLRGLRIFNRLRDEGVT